MLKVILPDGTEKQYSDSVRPSDVAAEIGPGLAKAALAISIDGEMADLATIINADAKVSIITGKSDEALDLLRHDAAHVMAEAVKELYPKTQVTIGPAIENGFYYDFGMPDGVTISDDDLAEIEAKMREIVAADQSFVRAEADAAEAAALFADHRFKREIIEKVTGGDVGDDLADEAVVERLLGVQDAARVHEFGGPAEADNLGQEPGATEFRQNAAAVEDQAQAGAFRRDSDVEGEDHRHADTDGRAVDGDDDGFGQAEVEAGRGLRAPGLGRIIRIAD